MTRSPFIPSRDNLNPTIPIFPLTGALLLPRGYLPLNIFEPRYLAMIDDALSADRMIGMVQPIRPNPPDPQPEIYATGCGGRITAFEETDDGRYLITLTGVCRFRVAQELSTTRGYRRVHADWETFVCDYEEEGEVHLDRDRLIAALANYFDQQGIRANWDAIKETGDERLITTLAMICPFEPSEKQALLEASSFEERANLMVAMLEMAVVSGRRGDPARH